jgi:hypothetical protein
MTVTHAKVTGLPGDGSTVTFPDWDAPHVVTGLTVAGAARVLGPFPFAFDDVGLTNGIEFYTPTVGDVILIILAVQQTGWDGTSPQWDVFSSTTGIFQYRRGNVNSFDPDHHFAVGGLVGFVATADPLKLVVSQDATIGGADPGSTQGEVLLYLVIATPVTP